MKYLREKKTRFGNGYLDVDIYERDDNVVPPAKRAKRRRVSPPHILAANERHSRNVMRQLAIHNFGAGDYYLTPTYSEQPDFESAQREMSNFIRRLKKLYEKKGTELKAMYVTEGGNPKADGGCTRVHNHMLINNAGISREEIERCWTGRRKSGRGYCNCSMIQPREDERGCERIAEYMSKSRTKSEKPGRRRWNCTRNLERPFETTIDNKFSRKQNDRVIDLVRAQNAVKQEQHEELRRILELRYNRKITELEATINPVTGWVYISARFKKQE